VIVAQGADKPAYIVNFDDRGVSYGNRREGDRILQDPHQVIKNNQYNAFAYSPSPEAPMTPLVVTNRPQIMVGPDPAAAAQRKEQAKAVIDERPAVRPHVAKTASANAASLPRAEAMEAVPLPQARPRGMPRHPARR
jgi:hypothetical protein